jgi:hypothetical protein
MEQTFWVLTHIKTGNVWTQTMSDIKSEVVKASCAALNCKEHEIPAKGFAIEQVTLVKAKDKTQ